MADIPKQNVPPSSMQEVSIRTLESDLEALGKSGGLVAPGETVSVARREPEARTALGYPSAVPQFPHGETYGAQVEARVAEKLAAGERHPLPQVVWWIIAGVGGAAILFLIGFFLPSFFKKEIPPTGTPPPPPPSASTPPPATSTPIAPPSSVSAFFPNASVFSAELLADERVAVALARAVSAATSTPFFARVTSTRMQTSLTLPDLIAGFNAGLDGALYETNFEGEYAAFVYKDARGLWPGVAFKLRAGKLPVVLQGQFAKLEQSGDLKNFFASDPGTFLTAWRSEQVGSEVARIRSFTKAGAVFSYGWFHNSYFLISTSLDGLREAVKQL